MATVTAPLLTEDAPTHRPRGHSARIHAIAFSPDGRLLASASRDGFILLWDPETGEPAGRPLAGNRDPRAERAGSVFAMDFSPDGCLLAWGSVDRKIHVWDLVS